MRPNPHRSGARRLALGALLAAVLSLLVSTSGAAQDDVATGDPAEQTANGPWNLAPTTPQDGPGRNWFILDMQPGQVLRDSVSLANTSDEPISFAIYPADAYNAPNSGQFAIRSASDPQEDIASWVTLSTDAYTVQPDRRVVIPFEIAVPDDAAPGDHVGAIAAMNVNPEGTTQSGGVQLDIMRIIGVRLYVNVAGPADPSLSVDDVSVSTDAPALGFGGSPSGTVTYTVTNDGNARLAPSVDVQVSGGLGGPDETLETGELEELLPGNSLTITEEWEGLPIIGPVTVTVTATGGDEVSATSETAVWIVPWALLLLLAVLLALVVVAFTWRRRRARDERDAAGGSPPE